MNKMLKRRDFLKVAGGMAIAGATIGLAGPKKVEAQRRFDGETLRVQFWAGMEGQTVRTGVVDSFVQKTGTKVIVTEGWTSASIAKIRAEKANPSTSVYMMDDIGVITAGREGLLEPLDLSRLPNSVDISPKFFVEGKGIAFFTYAIPLIYNTNIIKTPPTSWKILWDPQFKKKIAMAPVGAGSALPSMIMAAMVHGGSQYNMEPAWEALKALKPNVAVLEGNVALLAEMFRSDEIALLTGRAHYQFKPYMDKGYPIAIAFGLKEGTFATMSCATIAKNHPDKREVAEAFVNEALTAEAQTKMAHMLWYGPTNRKVKLPPEVARNLITQEEWDNLVPVNLDNVAAHREEWMQKYTRALL